MKKYYGMTLKIFLCFLIVAIISLALYKLINIKFDEARNRLAENSLLLTNKKSTQLNDRLKSLSGSVSLYVSNNALIKYNKDLSNYYNNIADGVSNETVNSLRKDLGLLYSKLYGKKTAQGLLPYDGTNIVAQSVFFKNQIKNTELDKLILNDKNIKNYLSLWNKIKTIIKNGTFQGIDNDFIITDEKGKIIFSLSHAAALGNNIFKGNVSGFSPILEKDLKAFPINSHNISVGFGEKPKTFLYTGTRYKNKNVYLVMLKYEDLVAPIFANNNTKSYFYLTDDSGNLIISSSNADIGKKLLPNDKIIERIRTFNYFGNFIKSGLSSYYVSYESVNYIGTFFILSTVTVGTQITIFTFIGAILALIIILLIAWLLALLIMRPVNKLKGAFENLSEDKVKNSTDISPKGELKVSTPSSVNVIDGSQAVIDENECSDKEIIESKLVQSSIYDQHDFTSAILNSSGIALMVLDNDNRIVRMNMPLAMLLHKQYGVSPYVIGLDLFKALPENYEYKQDIMLGLQKVRTTRQNVLVHTVTVINREDFKKNVHIEWTLSMIPGPDGNNYVSGVGLNVTEKYLARANLKENEEFLQIIMSRAQDAIIVTDDKGSISMVNEAAEKMLGCNFVDLKGKTMIPYVIPEEYRDEFMDDIVNGSMLEIYAINKNKDRFPIELSISKVKVIGNWKTLYIIRDVSLRKKREEEMFKALEKAKSAEKAKSEFLANMSHEIRTPLNGIIGFLGLLKHTKMDKTQLEYLNIIDSSSDSLLNIINDILDFSKIESGKMELEDIEFNTIEVFEQVTDLYAAKANEKGINLIVISDPKIPEWLIGDQLRLKQILSNLLSNAIKFTNTDGSITVGITLEKCDAEKCALRISVKDTGIGISYEKQSSIFDAFSQADSSVTRKYGGSGLGLAICVKIAKLMGGEGLQLNSAPGKGSEFYFNAVFKIGTNKSTEKPVFNDVIVALYDCSENMCLFRNACKEYMESLKCRVKYFETLEDFKSLGKVDIICMGYRGCDKELIQGIQKLYSDIPIIYLACDREMGDIKFLESKKIRVLTQPLNISKFLDAFTFLIRKNTNITQEVMDEEKNESVFSGHVLVVEDNAVNRRLADIMLRQFGLTVELAMNGKEAIAMFLRNKYDIIFMDIHMPVLDGVSASKEIIRIEQNLHSAHTPIVALTANVIEKDRDSYLKAGMDCFLAKPIERANLENVLIKYLYTDKAKTILENLGKFFDITDMDAIKKIVSEFISVASNQIVEMRQAVVDNNMDKLATIANSLKGAAINLRFNNIVEGSKRIESGIALNKDTDYGNILDDLEAELTRIKKVIG